MNLENLKKSALDEIAAAKNPDELSKIEIQLLGRKSGKVSDLMKEIPKLPPEKRGEFGKKANILKKEIEIAIEAKKDEFSFAAETAEFFDFSAPAKKIATGRHHPISKYIREIEDTFGRLGFSVVDGPEIDDEDHNFNALNIPPHHPAREMQDTFWVKNLKKHVLRTQTSNMQIHSMEKSDPPFRLIAPGKVFRKDSDATHSPMFHQVEGLLIDENVSLANLKFVLLTALRELISDDLDLRFRLSYFPFTEPSLEVDALLTVGNSKKWLEIGGAGMVHPNVLKNVGVDPQKWNGFAFGFGIERQIMIKHQIGDLRAFFENDLRFLEQF